MNVTKFYSLTGTLYEKIITFIDKYVEENDTDIDYEINGNVLNIIFNDNSRIVINTQEAFFQIWMASKIQGYHFEYKDDNWLCTRSGVEFFQLLNESLIIYNKTKN